MNEERENKSKLPEPIQKSVDSFEISDLEHTDFGDIGQTGSFVRLYLRRLMEDLGIIPSKSDSNK